MSTAIKGMAAVFRMRLTGDPGVAFLMILPQMLFALLFVMSRGEIRDEMFRLMFPLQVAILPCIAMLACDDIRRHYLLPVSSGQIACARLIMDAAVIFVLSLATSFVTMLMCGQSDWPIFRLALFVAAITPMWSAISWGFRQSQGCQFLLGLAMSVFLLGTLIYLSREDTATGTRHNYPPESIMDDAALLILGSGSFLAIVGSLLTYYGVRHDRCGEGWKLPDSFSEFFAMRRQGSVPTSADAPTALIWFQQSFAGAGFVRASLLFTIVTAIVGIVWFPGGLYSIPGENWPRLFLGILTVECILMAFLGGLRSATTEDKPPGNHLQTFFANVPVTDRQLARSTMFAGVKSMLPLTFLAIVAYLIVAIAFRFHPRPMSSLFHESNNSVALVFQAIGAVFLSWLMFSNCLWTWLTGNTKFFLAMLIVGAVSLYSCLAPVLFGPIGEYIRDSVNGSLLIGMFVLMLWMVNRARRMEFVGQRTIRRLMVAWLAAYVLVLTLLWFADSALQISTQYRWPWPVRSLIAVGLASLAVLPIPASRMAVYWNRHRD